MPLNLTHNNYGDYTPLARTPAGFKGHSSSAAKASWALRDELKDRPHFGVEETRSHSSGPQVSIAGPGKHYF